ncbi:hypothetical protein [Microviridae sp.]|nr:hypothetical protein [Microviridae sp.]
MAPQIAQQGRIRKQKAGFTPAHWNFITKRDIKQTRMIVRAFILRPILTTHKKPHLLSFEMPPQPSHKRLKIGITQRLIRGQLISAVRERNEAIGVIERSLMHDAQLPVSCTPLTAADAHATGNINFTEDVSMTPQLRKHHTVRSSPRPHGVITLHRRIPPRCEARIFSALVRLFCALNFETD